jgi:hypothetical protein
MTVTRIEDARALRTMGLPLDTPIEDHHCQFSWEAEKTMVEAFQAGSAFFKRVEDHARSQNASTYAAAKRAFVKMAGLVEKSQVQEVWGDTPDGGKALQNVESVVVAAVIRTKILPVVSEWRSVFGAVDAGQPF